MALTYYISEGNNPVTDFMRKYFPHTRPFLKEVLAELRNTETILPNGYVPWSIIGRAIDYRIRYYFKVTPPLSTSSIPGLLPARIWWQPKDSIGGPVFMFPEFSYHPAAPIWFERDGEYIGDYTSIHSPLGEFFTALDSLTIRVNPVARRLTEREENELNSYCAILGILDASCRALQGPPEELLQANPWNMVELLDIVKPNWIADLRNLSWIFYDKYSELLSKPSILNPNFENSSGVGAHGDIIVGQTLIDFKTSKSKTITRAMLYQILGYALLDHSDKFKLQSVGIYMVRQGTLFQWDIEEMVRRLSPHGLYGLEELRELFEREVMLPIRELRDSRTAKASTVTPGVTAARRKSNNVKSPRSQRTTTGKSRTVHKWYAQLGKDGRGSRPRCVLLMEGGRNEVAGRLTQLVDFPGVTVSPNDIWTPYGKPVRKRNGSWDKTPALEVRLDKSNSLVSPKIQKQLRTWWLRHGGNSPNWDIASTCRINGKQGLILIEAKAHDTELNIRGKSLSTKASQNSKDNHDQIGRAIDRASQHLNIATEGNWNLSRDSHYQLSNRFAWSWKVASLGVPVVLVYLGFLEAYEMCDRGQLFDSTEKWEDILKSYCENTIDNSFWGEAMYIGEAKTPLIPLIRTCDQDFDLKNP